MEQNQSFPAENKEIDIGIIYITYNIYYRQRCGLEEDGGERGMGKEWSGRNGGGR